MKAAVVRALGRPLVIEERPDPEPGRGQVVGTRQDLAEVFQLHAAGRTRVICETRPLAAVDDCIDEVLRGQVKARIVFDLGTER